jgi:hypothetical protein
MSRRALLCKSTLFAMLFAKRPVDERSEVILDPTPSE